MRICYHVSLHLEATLTFSFHWYPVITLTNHTAPIQFFMQYKPVALGRSTALSPSPNLVHSKLAFLDKSLLPYLETRPQN